MSFLEVKYTRGNDINGNTTESTTCDAMSNASIPGRPSATATAMDGITAISRVKRRRNIGLKWLDERKYFARKVKLTEILQCKKPSATAWPAIVAIMDELYQ